MINLRKNKNFMNASTYLRNYQLTPLIELEQIKPIFHLNNKDIIKLKNKYFWQL